MSVALAAELVTQDGEGADGTEVVGAGDGDCRGRVAFISGLVTQHTECQDRHVQITVPRHDLLHDRVVGVGLVGVEVHDVDLRPGCLQRPGSGLQSMVVAAGEHHGPGAPSNQGRGDRAADLGAAAQ